MGMEAVMSRNEPVLQMRLIVEVDDFDAAVGFYRDVLGLSEQAAFQGNGDARVAILEAGRATLEIANSAQKRMIDDVEVGRPTGPGLRVAFEVTDATAATRALVTEGAELVADPRETPWRSLNSRVSGPGNLQITLFEELEPLETRRARPGFGTAAERPPAG
jgi:predicted enzyme related to lactoylglutathione lyase